jgi:hypothetical protein
MIARFEFSGLDEVYKKLVRGYPGYLRDFWASKPIEYCLWHLKVLEEEAEQMQDSVNNNGDM